MKTAYVISAVIAIVLACVVTCSWAECTTADAAIALQCSAKAQKAGTDPSCDVIRDIIDCFKPVVADCPQVKPAYDLLKKEFAAKCGSGVSAARPSFGVVMIAAAMLTIFISLAK